MLRIQRTIAGLACALVLSFSFVIANIAPLTLVTGVTAVAVTQVACGPDTLEKLNTTLNQTAHALEAAIDTNGKLYAAGTYGIEVRQKVAKVVHDSNEYLIQALDIAKTLTKATFEGRKLEILQKLTLAATGLSVGNQTIDLVLQSVATLINQAVTIVQLFGAGDTKYMDRIVPKLNARLADFGRVRKLEACS